MPENPAPPSDTHKTLRESYVPLEQRESQHPNWKPFAYDTIKFFVVAKLSALAGLFAGNSMAAKNMKLGPLKMDGQTGAMLAGTAGVTYELYDHWQKTEGKRLGVANISSDLRAALDPVQLEKESTKEEALVNDLKKLEELLSQSPGTKSHIDAVSSRREHRQRDSDIAK